MEGQRLDTDPDARGADLSPDKEHGIRLETTAWFPPSVAAGAELTLRIRAACSSGCDLRGADVALMASDGPVVTTRFTSTAGTIAETDEVVVRAPSAVGAHEWSVRVGPAPDAAHPQAEGLAVPSFRTEAHRTSLAVWDVPSPVEMGRTLTCRIGAKCAQGCDLSGREVEVLDEVGGRLATVALGDASLAGSSGLFWGEVDLAVPPVEGLVHRAVELPAQEMPLAHESARHRFSFAAAKPTEHKVTVEVVQEGSGEPVPAAEVRLGAYRGSTDAAGRAVVAVAQGSYELLVWKVGYEAPTKALEIEENSTVRVEAELLPDRSSWEDD